MTPGSSRGSRRIGTRSSVPGLPAQSLRSSEGNRADTSRATPRRAVDFESLAVDMIEAFAATPGEEEVR